MDPLASAQPSRPGSPFDDVKPDVALAALALLGVASLAVSSLPRLAPVHLFTLGIVTPIIVAFSQHQAETVLRVPGRPRTWLRVALVAGAVLVVAGVGARAITLVGVGATLTSAAVLVSWWRLRQARKRALGARFVWLVRSYERAHGAFLHGALLGALLGVGLIPGWAYLGTRLAHLHAMVLGFGAVTLLATAVLYGPTLLRAQLEPGADATASRWLRRIASAASVAVLALLLMALPGAWSTAARLFAGVALAVCAIGATVVTLPLVRTAARKGRATPLPGLLLTAAVAWLTLGIAADAVLVIVGGWRWFDALGIVVLVGALGQAIAATLLHVVISWLPRARRLRVAGRVHGAPAWIAAVPQVAVLCVAVLAVR